MADEEPVEEHEGGEEEDEESGAKKKKVSIADDDEAEESVEGEGGARSTRPVSAAPSAYGEEYEGEDIYDIPVPPPDLDATESVTGSVEEVTHEEEQQQEEKEEPTKTVEPEADVEREEDMEKEDEGLHVETPTHSVELDRMSSESIFEPVFLKPREKTASEIKFETKHREMIEEEMRKFVQRLVMREEEVVEKRARVEKTRTAIGDVDVTGLYPAPKVLESEVSFAFDDEEEIERIVAKLPESDADIVKQVMDTLREESKYDPDSIFAKHMDSAIAKVQRVVEDAIAQVKRGVILRVPKVINDSLPELKPNLRQTAIRILNEKLPRFGRIIETEEYQDMEAKEVPGKREILIEAEEGEVRVVEVKPEVKHAKMQMEKVMEKPGVQRYDMSKRKFSLPVAEIKKRAVGAKALAKAGVKEGEEEGEVEEMIPYEKIDWELLLTESEKRIEADSRLKAEMDKYIARRKKELLLEGIAEEEERKREKRYKSTDPTIMLENLNLNVTMKFILNTGEIFTCAYSYFMVFGEIKEDLAGIFKIPPDVLIIYRDDVEVHDHENAHDLRPKIQPFDCVTFRLLTLDNDRWPLRSSNLELPVPDIITCTVETGKDHTGAPEYKEVVVEIEQRKIKKPFVGGYRNVCTGVEYHHAFSQSDPRQPFLPYERRVCKLTQTSACKSKNVDTNCSKYTQMSRSDFYVSTEFDKIMTAQPYTDYDTWLRQKNMDGKIVLIQKYVRAMIIRRFIKRMADEYRERKMREEEEERKRKVTREIRVKQDIIGMVYPRTKADFEALYAMVERWRKGQIERIGALKTEGPRKAEMCAVLEKEIKLLEAIEVHRIAVAKEQKKKKEMDFLAKVASPVTWTGYRGMTIKMDTLKTQRARELREMYLSLMRDDLNYQDRIELLISLKYALRVNCTRLTDELVTLLNRECEMLIRGVSSKKLEYLRRRINHLFLKYFKEPEFNPEVAKYDPEYNIEPLKQNVLFCKMCHQMKMYKEFGVTVRDKACNVCSSCRTTYNIALTRVDLNPYRYILKCVRRDEQKRNCFSSSAFILQDEDMRFLVQNIWHGRSALSECDNMLDLRMPRWDRDRDWTPWNCILLTETEAKAHLRSQPGLNYEPQLVGEVISKHQLAKRHFKQMFQTEERMRDSGKWANVVDVREYTAAPVTADLWDLTEAECERLVKEKKPLYEVHETRRKDDNFVKYI